MFEDFIKEKQVPDGLFEPEMLRKMKFHYELLCFVKKFERDDGICYISQMKIADQMNCSHALVNQTIKKLHQSDNMIEKVDAGRYIVHQTDVLNYGVFRNFLSFMVFAHQIPEFIHMKISEKAEIMGLPDKEISRIYGWLNMCIGSSREESGNP